ncbi:MAG: metallophosphoesterase [Candidatus Azobacteroides sp.]|nr:metallophosphoesterase [Candidatus Azobacteroides sp.]
MKKIDKENNKPTVVLGDIHGLTYWKKAVDENPACRYIFLGDYLDPYQNIAHKQLLNNLKEIIRLKKDHVNDVILLLGNHDLHYIISDIELCTRFDYKIEEAAHALFSENAYLFTYAFQENKRIFTHAGISEKWFFDDFGGDADKNIAEQLNNPHHDQLPALYRCGAMRGGDRKAVGGIFWADIDELTDPLPGYTQFVGHNRVDKIIEYANNDGQITFCDCLYNGIYLKLECENEN